MTELTYEDALVQGILNNKWESAMWLREGVLGYCDKCWYEWDLWHIFANGRHDFPAYPEGISIPVRRKRR